jgi:hypothetical protein
MKTNEEIKEALLDLAEKAVEELVGHIEDLKEGDLDQLEQTVFKAIMEFGRTALEELLRQKAREEEAASPTEGSCGHTLRLVSYREKQVNTVMGPLTIRRAYYHCQEPKRLAGRQNPLPACPGVAPFDQRWGLVGRRSSPGVRRLVSFLSARLTHEEVAETLARLLPLAISARQVGHVIQPAGEAFRQFEDQQVQKLLTQGAEKHRSEKERQEEHGEPIRRLYVEMDGVMARLRRGSVPMEAHEQQREGDAYREVKVGAVFVGEPGPERSDLVPGVLIDRPVSIKYVARRTTAEEFAPQLYALARHHGLSRARQIVILGDGAKWIWNLAEEQFPGALQIVDEYHAREHVWDVARAAFAAEPDLRDSWAQAAIDHLSEGKVEQVIAAIEQLPPLAPEPGKTRSLRETEADYFRTNMSRMRYPVFRAQGIHLGSGIAEAACKTVVATRTKRSGMRWTPQGLDAILALRTAALNQEFDQSWQACREAV